MIFESSSSGGGGGGGSSGGGSSSSSSSNSSSSNGDLSTIIEQHTKLPTKSHTNLHKIAVFND